MSPRPVPARRMVAVVAAVLAVLAALVVPGTAAAAVRAGPEAACESPDALAVSYLPDDGVQIRRDACGLPVRAVVSYRVTAGVGLYGFPSGPLHFTKWSCGGVATGELETSVHERGGDWLITYAKGWQVRRADGRWHLRDVVYTVADHAFVTGRPFATDRCSIDPRDRNWDDDVDDGFTPS